MYGIIYQYTNTLSGLIYVGQTIDPARRHRDYARDVASTQPNPRVIIQAMRRAGLDAFTYQILAEATTKDELNRLEIQYIAVLHTNNPLHGYNRTTGGDGRAGFTHSEETRAKMSQAKRGKTRTPFSEETKAKMSRAQRGRIVSDETRAKIGLANRGFTHSEETRAKISQKAKARFQEDPTSSMT